ncbi:LysM peptidoglycan-binding domain-containing protein [Saprospira sp. CCB-QB6]|uniref:LysM peptidoglycan-binding domain-containing protein n=1 Tax=Saprospira sp. CCB-QB6 TaxID=3023936 RepID=UPI00234AB6C0|nr:LysM peptidoglycan-binding domain-containing protein [Saprospira sp. CCB-QB6]WCL82197.1 LysM peptidoglycan-binding domain-containing protein [Saprospira sp. CCB-QB6]
MKKRLWKSFLVAAATLGAGFTQAQTANESTLLFDANCMQEYEYQAIDKYTESAFHDFMLQVSPKQKLAFRVKTTNLNAELLETLPQKALGCTDLTTINGQFIQEVNSLKKSVNIAVYNAQTKRYHIHQVSQIASFTENDKQLSYKDRRHSFVYAANQINSGEDLDATPEGKVLFVENDELSCLKQRQFRSFDRLQPRVSENLYFLEGIGLYLIQQANGSLQLKRINKKTIPEHIRDICYEKMNVENGIASRGGSSVQKTAEEQKKRTGVLSAEDQKARKGVIHGELGSPFDVEPIPAETKKQTTATEKKTTPVVSDDPNYYIVQENDNLYKIAAKYNTRVDVLMGLNNLTSTTIDRGRRIKVVNDGSYVDPNPYVRTDEKSGKKYKVHVVRQGENLYDIAKKYGLSMTQLVQINKLPTEKASIDQELIVGLAN